MNRIDLHEGLQDRLRCSLADYAHRAWSGWMKYLFSKSRRNMDGSVTIPASLVNRWSRQVATSFADLPLQEQQSDLLEADTIITVLRDS